VIRANLYRAWPLLVLLMVVLLVACNTSGGNAAPGY
jgi:predicted small secreted protein